ncbi:MAG: RNA 2',3'-cyclic phosphodiesterase [Woeseiaceae bacterium]|jgi:2'-5' RNA ligase|nr:RNA 2',3'-cyclic phosphodiesterase [Woeseiaceae bacterium]
MNDRKRLFFALWPDARQRERLRNIVTAGARHIEGRHVPRGNWHITLAFIGAFPEAKTDELMARSAELPVEPVRLRFDRIEYWARARIACLAPATVPAALERLVAALNELLTEFGHRPEDRQYRPHLTLARAARPFATERLAQPLTLEWSDFELVESIHEQGGVRYLPLKQGL